MIDEIVRRNLPETTVAGDVATTVAPSNVIGMTYRRRFKKSRINREKLVLHESKKIVATNVKFDELSQTFFVELVDKYKNRGISISVNFKSKELLIEVSDSIYQEVKDALIKKKIINL